MGRERHSPWIILLLLPLVWGEIGPQDCISPKNSIIAENCLPGNDSTEWDVNADGDPSIQGFATRFSVVRGEVVQFKIKTDSSNYRLDIFRVGWYGGAGARQVGRVDPLSSLQLPQEQPECIKDAETLHFDCGGWGVSAEWEVPQSAVSGVYLARLVRSDGDASWRQDNSQYGADIRFSFPGDIPGKLPKPPQPWPHAYGAQGHGRMANALKEPQASLVYFVVRDEDSKADMVFQTADTTWQAYNLYGGANVYYGLEPPYRRAYKVSYNRPFQTRATRAVNILFGAEYPMIRWLESQGYDVTYQSGIDTDRQDTSNLLRHKIFLSVGHDEYWSGSQRTKVEEARDQGLSLAFFSGNEVYWRVRWEDNQRTMVVYKESQELAKKDPKLDEWTGTFRDGRPINPLGAQPENALTGTIFTVNAWRHDALEVPSEFSGLRFWRHTSVADMQEGEVKVIKPGLLGHEWDEDLDNGFRPPGLVRLSRTTVNNLWMVQDYITNCDSGTATHSLVMYRSKSGSLVFGAGTVQWSWGLDPYRDTETGVPPERANPTNIRVGRDQMGAEKDIQQATLNLFTDMGVEANVEDLGGGLTRPAGLNMASSPPSVSFASPTEDTTFSSSLVVKGTASKSDGGVVAAVEYSLSSAPTSWHPANFTRVSGDEWNWTLKLGEGAPGHDMESLGAKIVPGLSTVLTVRAVDDSYNVGPSAELTVTMVP